VAGNAFACVLACARVCAAVSCNSQEDVESQSRVRLTSKDAWCAVVRTRRISACRRLASQFVMHSQPSVTEGCSR
jgi:hypothetical protein